MRSSADAAAKHKHYHQRLYSEKRSLIVPWFLTLFLLFLANYRLWSELCFFFIFSCWFVRHCVQVSPWFYTWIGDIAWSPLLQCLLWKEKNHYEKKQVKETTSINNRKRLLSKVLAKGVAKRTHKIRKCCLKEDDILGRILRQIRGQVLRTTEDQDVYRRDSPSVSFPFGTIYRRQDCQVEDDYLEYILNQSCGSWWVFFITIHYRCVLGFVSSLSFEPHDLVHRPGIRFIHSTRTEPSCVANSQDKIRLNFAVRSRSRVFAVGLEIQN